MTQFPNLFAPLRVKNVMLKNRIIAAPMGVPKAKVISSTNYGGLSLLDKSQGGVAVITVGNNYLANIANEKDAFSKYGKDVTREAISVSRQSGALSMLEVPFHGIANLDGTIQGPSNGIHFTGGIMKEMSYDDMECTKQQCVLQALEAKKFGFDLLMLHFGHDSLCSLFLSPIWNKRSDEYGGTLENRIRYSKEVLEAVRNAVGNDFPILVRVSRHLKVQESFSEEDMLTLIKSIEPFVDIINVSCGMDCYGGTIDKYTANTYSHSTIFLPRMYNLEFSEKVKKETNLIVCTVGGISDPFEAEKAIKEGKTDLVMLGRQLVADPYWPKKAQNGCVEDIVPCLRCLNCYHISTEHSNTQCSVNPRFRRENRVPLKIEKVKNPKRIIVIGGGPAGMKAAITADAKGHEVILIEKENCLGGNLKYADYGDYKEDIKKYREYLIRKINNSNVKVQLQTMATFEYVKMLKPDGLIIAVGAEEKTPSIKGIEFARSALTIYPHLEECKGNVVIIGGGSIGSELALDLHKRGNKVSIIEQGDALASKANWLYRQGLYNAMKDIDGNIDVYLQSKVDEIKKNGVQIIDENLNKHFIYADVVVYSIGLKEKKELAFSFFGITPETAMIGDCYRVAQILEATNDAYFIAENMMGEKYEI